MLKSNRTTEQPLKIPFITAVFLTTNPQRPEVVQESLERTIASLRGHLETGSWREVKLQLRFIACLQGLLEGDGVFTILDDLFSRAVDLQTASSEDVSFPILSTLLDLFEYYF